MDIQNYNITAEVERLLKNDKDFLSQSDADKALWRKQMASEIEQRQGRQLKAIKDAAKLQSKGKASVTMGGINEVKKNCIVMAESIKGYLDDCESTPGPKSEAYTLLKKGVPECSSVVILQGIINGAFRVDEDGQHISMQSLAIQVSKRIEGSLDKKDRPKKWQPSNRLKCGAVCIQIAQGATSLFEDSTRKSKKFKPMKAVEPSKKLIENARYFNQIFTPFNRPMTRKPRPWTTSWNGGYLLNAKDGEINIVKAKHEDQIKGVTPAKMPKVFDAINGIQSVAWKINKPMLEMVQQLWNEALKTKDFSLFIDDDEIEGLKKSDIKKRLAQLKIETELYLSEAWRYADRERFWLPVNMDWRGRLYYLPMLNPQSCDMVRAILDFADEKPLDDERWFLSYGQRLYGDEKELARRLEWSKTESDFVIDTVFDLNESWWRQGKEKWQFLRWCLAYLRYVKEKPYGTFKTGMPCYIDATASGIQHFAALLRDEKLAKAVNLVIGGPQDIYGSIAQSVNDTLQEIAKTGGTDAQLAELWLGLNIDRKDIKPILMTIPYQKKDGSHRRDIRKKYTSKLQERRFDYDQRKGAAEWLFGKIDDAIKKEFPSIHEVPEWLKAIGQEYNRIGRHIDWPLQDGFIVRQRYLVSKGKRIKVIFYGQRAEFTLREETDQLHKKDSLQGIVANFIHSLDGAALRETAVRFFEYGKTDIGVVHDCYASTFFDIGWLEKAALQGFVQTHYDDLLKLYHEFFQKELGQKLPKPPKQGKYDINAAPDAIYAIS